MFCHKILSRAYAFISFTLNLPGKCGFGPVFYSVILSAILSSQVIATPDTIRKQCYLYHEIITINDTGYRSEVTYFGKGDKTTGDAEFVLPAATTLKKSIVLVPKGSKWKELPGVKRSVRPQPDLFNFYNDQVVTLSFTLPEETRYKLSFETECSELMLFSLLTFRSIQADTTIIEIRIPKSKQLYYRLIDTLFMMALCIDSTETDSMKVIRFKGLNAPMAWKMVSTPPFVASYTYRPKVPGVQIVVVPASFAGRPEEYINDWYLEHLKLSISPDIDTRMTIDSITSGNSDPDSVIAALFAYARDKIRYVDLYRGLETIVPHDVNDILQSRMGDCKDKANFLCQALISKGFHARLAICSSRDHPMNMDFPSFSGANHMICALWKDSTWYPLDATDPGGVWNCPGTSIFGRTMFILGEGRPLFVEIPVPEAEVCTSSLSLDLAENEGKLSGTLRLVFYGTAGNILRVIAGQYGKSMQEQIIPEYLRSLSKRADLGSITCLLTTDSIVITSVISFGSSVITHYGQKEYIDLAFFPLIHQSFPNFGSNDLILASAFLDKASVCIDLRKPVLSLKGPEKRIEGDPCFTFKSTFSGSVVRFNYTLRIEDSEISLHEQPRFYGTIDKYVSTFEEVLIAETSD